MLGALFLAGVSFYLYRLLGGAPNLHLRSAKAGTGAVTGEQKIVELTEYASRLRAANKYTSAEKVYLQILKIDHKHVSTYSRLGTLYSAMKNYGDAIECFQMTTQLKPSGTTFYNLGLAYFENKNYIKAVAAFEKSIMFEPTVQRYIGLAKTYKKTGENTKMIGALEQAIVIEPSTKVLWLLADAYDSIGKKHEASSVKERIEQLDPKDERLRKQKIPARTI